MAIAHKFSVPIYHGPVRSEEILSRLIEIVEERRVIDDLSSPWTDNIQTSFKYIDGQIGVNTFSDSPEVLDEITFHCSRYAQELSNFPHQIEIKETWYNISNKGQYQNWHTHPKFDMSGCIYIKTNGTGIDFQSPNPAYVHSKFPREFIDDKTTYFPGSGEVVIFPSFLSHSVPKNNDGERISITFNANVKD